MSDNASVIENHSTPDQEDPGPASSQLPFEILEQIADLVDDSATLARMMRASRTLYALAAPRLYCEPTISRTNAQSFHLVLETLTKEDLGMQGSVENRTATAEEQTAQVYKEEPGQLDDDAQRPRRLDRDAFDSKYKLLSMVRRLHIQSLPPSDVCKRVVELCGRDRSPLRQTLSLSLRPCAVWELMYSHVFRYESRTLDTDYRLEYLQLFDVQDMCIQLPVMDNHLDRSMQENRYDGSDPTRYHQGLKDLRDALAAPLFEFDRGLDRFFDLFAVRCRHLTIHNLVMISFDRAFRSIDPATATVQAFFRPCAGLDDDIETKVQSGQCLNHPVSGDVDIADGEFRVSREVLSSPQEIDLVDMDWVRGHPNALRDRESINAIRTQVDQQLGEFPEEEKQGWGQKSLKMSSEVEACRCCNKGQLTATESSISYLGPF